jgi:hypothetical protein
VPLTSWASRWNSPLPIFIKGPGGSPKPSLFMSEQCFEISNILPVNYDSRDKVSLVEVDRVFLQKVG